MATKRITKTDYLELEEKYNKLQEEYNELKFRLEYYQADCDKLSRENLELQGKVDLLNQIINIKDSNIQELTNENEELKANAPISVHKHNERNAGRKNKFSDEIINYVVDMKNNGWSYVDIKRKVCQQFGKSISVGSISNIIKNNS